MKGWAIANKDDSENGVISCRNNEYTPKSIIVHYKSKKQRIYHFTTHHYLSFLYCDDSDHIQCCVSNMFPCIS